MTNYNLNDNRGDQNAPDQYDPSGAGDEQAFIYTETKKPLNRNFVVLLLIAVVGASMIYLMYLRSQFHADLQTPDQAQANEAVTSFMNGGSDSIEKLDQDLARTKRQVELFQQDPAAGQIPPSELKLNPFSFGNLPAKTQPQQTQVQAPVANPADPVRAAVDKAKIQMILYSATNSSVTINNWVYKTGDRIEISGVAFTVKSIGPKSITLSHPVGEFVVDAPGTQGM